MKIKILKKVAKEIFSKKKEIYVAYLYGSFLKKVPFRDIDIGLLIREDYTPNELYEFRLANIFEKKVKSYKKSLNIDGTILFDIRILNNRSLRFLFSVLKNSITIYCKNENKKIEFESKVMIDYLDIKPHHELYEHMRGLRYENR
ncbi:MAG: nucleotidyltransferase domain-containing protein [Candidatus Helarchaeota archaeon]